MSYLVYGVVSDPPADGEAMVGMQGREVFLVSGDGLCAAVSETDSAGGAPPVAELLAYGRVVEELHRRQAVVPMRYGCFFGRIEAVRNALQERRCEYATLLSQVAGHVEMGIRIVLAEEVRRSRPDIFVCAPATGPPQGNQPADGRSYLALRREHYQMAEETRQGRQALVDRYLQTFCGLFNAHRIATEVKNDTVVLSLSFLTPKGLVERFRETFRCMENKEAMAMLSGPWPPYTFVCPAPCNDQKRWSEQR